MSAIMEKPKFDQNQLIKASDVTRRFDSFRKQEKEYRVLTERMERLEQQPDTGVRWRHIRRSGK